MKNVCIYFQIHHPFTLQTFRFFDIGESKTYYNECLIEKEIKEAIVEKYIPTNEFIANLIKCHEGKFNLSFNITDTTLDQLLIYSPGVISSFRELAETQHVEFIGNPAGHSIASLAEEEEFIKEIKQGRRRIEHYFGQTPRLFANTDLLFSNQIASSVAKAGFTAILTNGIGRALQWQSPNYIYGVSDQKKSRILFRNETVSEELSSALECNEKNKAFNLIDKLSETLKAINQEEPILNIYLNYGLLGGFECQLKHEIFSRFISNIVNSDTLRFSLPSEVIDKFAAVSEVGTDTPACWVEHFHPSYFPGNELQKEAIKQLFRNTKKVNAINNSNLKTDWQYLQSSDHFHLMDENHPDYRFKVIESRAFKSKYEAFINYMNILSDFRVRLKMESKKNNEKRAALKPIRVERKRKIHEFK